MCCAPPLRSQPARRVIQAQARISATMKTRLMTRRRTAASDMVELAAAVQAAKAVRRRDDVGNAYAVFFVDHDHLALCDQVAATADLHGLAGKAVQLSDRTLAKRSEERRVGKESVSKFRTRGSRSHINKRTIYTYIDQTLRYKQH